jgi:hypothetical protein
MGQPAARVGDMHVCPMVTGIVPHVGGPILPPGCPTVLIGGQPAARLGDLTAHGGAVVMGFPMVLVGPRKTGNLIRSLSNEQNGNSYSVRETIRSGNEPQVRCCVLKHGLPVFW